MLMTAESKQPGTKMGNDKFTRWEIYPQGYEWQLWEQRFAAVFHCINIACFWYKSSKWDLTRCCLFFFWEQSLVRVWCQIVCGFQKTSLSFLFKHLTIYFRFLCCWLYLLLRQVGFWNLKSASIYLFIQRKFGYILCSCFFLIKPLYHLFFWILHMLSNWLLSDII